MKCLLRAIPVLLATSLFAFAQAPLPPRPAGRGPGDPIDYEAIRQSKTAEAVRIHEKITLDGRFDEPAWQLSTPISGFLQWAPRHGEPSPERTEVRFLYDDDNLYVGFTNFDSEMDRVLSKELKEDFNFNESDNVGVVLDSLHDHRSAFTFGVNAAGAKRDQQISNDSQFNMDWDGVWDAKVSRDDKAWRVEFQIPFKTLRFTDSPTQEWGLNLNRRILRRNEESIWSLVPQRYRISRVSQAGSLKGLENIHQGRNLKITPYVTAGITQARTTGGSTQTLKSLGRLFCTGAHKDCGYDGGADMKFSLTSSLTLDATYRTDFAQVEVDTQQVNLTRFNLFFPEKRDFFIENSGTFNFGGNSNGNLVPFFSRRIGLSAAGTPIPIVGGARVTGQVRRYDIGFLEMTTDSLGTTPSNTYLVGRVKRNLLRNSWIGALATSRDSTKPSDYNRVYGADTHFQLFERLELDSFLLKSTTPQKSGRDWAAKGLARWRTEEINTSFEYNTVQGNFNPEVGFVRRGANTQYSYDFAWQPLLRSSDLIRNLNFSTSLDYFEGSETGKVETRSQEGTAGVQFENNANLSFTVNQTFDRLDKAFVIRRGSPDISIDKGDYTYLTWGLNASSAQGRRFSVNGNLSSGEFWDGHRKSTGGGMGWNPNEHVSIDFSYSRNAVTLPRDRSFTTQLVGSRFVYAFSPRAFLNAFIQYNADTHQVSSNVRLDIIHHPLSHLYVVYNDRRDSTTGQLVDRALILKLTNLFNF